MRRLLNSCLFVVALAAVDTSVAQQGSLASSLGLFVYPSGEQALDQQELDEFQCYQWSKNATGVDPLVAQPAPRVEIDGGEGGAAGRGALRGAARAALIADIADEDTSDAAARGALIGAVRGRRHQQARNEQAGRDAEAEIRAQNEAQTENFRKGFSACMEGRKYTVK